MRDVADKSREIQDYYSVVTMKSSGEISADPAKQVYKLRPTGQIRPAKPFCQK